MANGNSSDSRSRSPTIRELGSASTTRRIARIAIRSVAAIVAPPRQRLFRPRVSRASCPTTKTAIEPHCGCDAPNALGSAAAASSASIPNRGNPDPAEPSAHDWGLSPVPPSAPTNDSAGRLVPPSAASHASGLGCARGYAWRPGANARPQTAGRRHDGPECCATGPGGEDQIAIRWLPQAGNGHLGPPRRPGQHGMGDAGQDQRHPRLSEYGASIAGSGSDTPIGPRAGGRSRAQPGASA